MVRGGKQQPGPGPGPLPAHCPSDITRGGRGEGEVHPCTALHPPSPSQLCCAAKYIQPRRAAAAAPGTRLQRLGGRACSTLQHCSAAAARACQGTNRADSEVLPNLVTTTAISSQMLAAGQNNSKLAINCQLSITCPIKYWR